MTRRLLAALFMTATAFVLVARAQPGPDIKIKPVKPADSGVTKPKDDADPKSRIEDLPQDQDRLKRQFDEFKQSLLHLAQRLENSSRPEDKEKAKVIKEALDQVGNLGIDAKFTKLINDLKAGDTFKDTDKLQDVIGRNDELRKDLNLIIDILMKDDKDKERKRKIEEVTRLLEQLKDLISKEERIRARVDLKRDGKEIKPDQDKANDRMQKLADPNAIPKAPDYAKAEGKLPPKSESKDGKAGEPKNDTKDPKGDDRPKEGKPTDSKPGDDKESKPGDSKDAKEAKPGDNKESKPGDNKEGKPSDSKDGKGADSKEGKPSDPKDGKGADSKEGKPSDSKDGKGSDSKEGKAGDSKPGDGKEGKPSDSKDGKGADSKEGKPGDPKDGKGGDSKDGKPGEGKPGDSKDGKPGENKPGDSKPGDNKNPTKPGEGAKPGEGKPGEPKPGDPKPGEGKPGDAKPGDAKPGEAKPGEAKPGDGKPSDSKGKGDGKGSGKPGEGKPGEGKPGEGKPSPSQPGQPSQTPPGESKPGGGGSPPPGGKPPPPPPPSDLDPARKKIKDAEQNGQKASKDLEKNKPEDAGPNVDKTIDDLNQAKKRLEELLRTLREQEVERILAQLQARCEKMLAMQIAVRDGTVNLDKVIQAHENKKPDRADEQTSNGLADKEDLIVKEANGAIRIIEAEGSAVAFAEVFKQVRDDMVTVKGRLDKTDTGVVTVQIENDIIGTLQEMIDALKKAIKDNKDKPKPPGPPKPPGKPPNPRLIDELAELKMIRSMQEKVNKRTELYGKQYPDADRMISPVKVTDPKLRTQIEKIQEEFQDLSKRQDKIHKITDDIAKGKNKNND